MLKIVLWKLFNFVQVHCSDCTNIIYPMDILIWHTLLSAIVGGVMGARARLGEQIRSLEMVHKRFESFPEAFASKIVSPQTKKVSQDSNKIYASIFSPFWNEIIKSLRKEDFISTREKDLLSTPSNSGSGSLRFVHWPLFLLSSKTRNETTELAKGAAKAVYDFYEVVTHDLLSSDLRELLDTWNILLRARNEGRLFSRIEWPKDPEIKEQVKRLHLLLTVKGSATNIPKNLEARRLEFFTNSLFMDMPTTKPVSEMMPFCVFTPYYSETVLYSSSELRVENEDGISTLFYLQKIFPGGVTFKSGGRIMNGANVQRARLMYLKCRHMVSVECWKRSATVLCLPLCPQMYKNMANDSSTDKCI